MKTIPSPVKQAGKLLILSRRDEEILRAFYFYHFMTAIRHSKSLAMNDAPPPSD